MSDSYTCARMTDSLDQYREHRLIPHQQFSQFNAFDLDDGGAKFEVPRSDVYT